MSRPPGAHLPGAPTRPSHLPVPVEETKIDPAKQTLLAVEERLIDARRALAHAREFPCPFTPRIRVLEAELLTLSRELLEEVNR